MDGMQLLQQIAARFPEVAVIMMTAHGTVPLAVEAMKTGAADFVLKPFDRQRISNSVCKALTAAPHKQEKTSSPLPAAGAFLSDSERCARLSGCSNARRLENATVLLRGETGTGKELAARAASAQQAAVRPIREGPTAPRSPMRYLESELFGYEKGAFTGAAVAQAGPAPNWPRRHPVPR